MINCNCMCHVLNHIAKCNKLNDEISTWVLLYLCGICYQTFKYLQKYSKSLQITIEPQYQCDQGFEQTILMLLFNADLANECIN